MTERMIEVQCNKKECMYYFKDPNQPKLVFCKHPDKAHYMECTQCPLFRLNWANKQSATQKYLKLLNRQ